MKRIFFYLGIFILLLSVASCDKDEPNNGGFDPGKEVEDPVGTVSLVLRNDFDNTINRFGINRTDNFDFFNYVGGMIADLGPMKGLGNVTYIPTTGWASSCAVIPGHGYVVCYSYEKKFMRLYVEEYVTSTLGEILGARVKYQTPFNGSDGVIKLENSQLAMDAEGGSITVRMTQDYYVPFEVESSESWCQVQGASTNEVPFIQDAIVVTVDRNITGRDREATVTLKTAYGKATTLHVKQVANGVFIIPSLPENQTLQFPWTEETQWIDIYTNVAKEDINIQASAEWFTAQWMDKPSYAKRPLRFIADNPVTRTTLREPQYYSLAITCQTNSLSQMRTDCLTLSCDDQTAPITITQQFINNPPTLAERIDVPAEGSSSLIQAVNWGGISSSQCTVEIEDCDWAAARTDQWSGLIFYVLANPNEIPRQAVVKIIWNYNGKRVPIASTLLVQAGAVYKDVYKCFDSNGGTYSFQYPLPAGTEISSSADWLTATYRNGNIDLRMDETNIDLKAFVSISGRNVKIYVSQSKYKVADTYNEGKVAGSIIKLDTDTGIGYIVSEELGSAQWSTENIQTSAWSKTDGMANMEIIRGFPNYEKYYPAFALVENLNRYQNSTKWYLPAIDELYPVYDGLPAELKKNNGPFWTSSEITNSTAYGIDPRSWGKLEQYKPANYRVIALLQFNLNQWQ